MTWMHGIVVDLEIALEGYHKRSALHGPRAREQAIQGTADGRCSSAGARRGTRPPRAAAPQLGRERRRQTRLGRRAVSSRGRAGAGALGELKAHARGNRGPEAGAEGDSGGHRIVTRHMLRQVARAA